MPFKRVGKQTIGILVLLSTLWAVLATSQLNEDLSDGTFTIKSDCTSPVSVENITVTANQITDPFGVDYTDFGFPDTTVTVDSDVVGVVGLVTRVCKTTYKDESDSKFIFSCFDNGAFACTIFIKGR
jgi:hypothetical protein